MAFDLWSIGGGKVIGSPPKLGIGALTVSPTLEGSGLISDLKSGAGDLEATATLAASGTNTSFDLVDNQGTAVTHRTGTLTGGSAGTQLTCSLWFKLGALPTASRNIVDIGDGVTALNHIFMIQVTTEGNILFSMKDLTGPAVRVSILTNDTPLSAGVLYHLYFSVNLATEVASIYLNGTALTSFSNNAINNGNHSLDAVGESVIGTRHENPDATRLDLAEFGEFWLDDEVQPLADFYASGRVYLGSIGQNPTGSAPLIYLNGNAALHNTGNPNLGTGGAFEIYDAGNTWSDV